MTTKERFARLAEYVIHCGESAYRLSDVLPFPIRSGIFERMHFRTARRMIDSGLAPQRDFHLFEAAWDKLAEEALLKSRPPWYRRLHFKWGAFRWPKPPLTRF
jgi:hypothetical protein